MKTSPKSPKLLRNINRLAEETLASLWHHVVTAQTGDMAANRNPRAWAALTLWRGAHGSSGTREAYSPSPSTPGPYPRDKRGKCGKVRPDARCQGGARRGRSSNKKTHQPSGP